MVFAETALIDNIQHSIDEWAEDKSKGERKTAANQLHENIGKELKRYGYKKIAPFPFDEANEIQAKIMSALENGSEIIYYKLRLQKGDVFLASGVSRNNLRIDYLSELIYWDDEGDADDLETALLFADDLLARMGLDYQMKQVMANGIMNLVKTWRFDNDAENRRDMEWWVKKPFTLFQPFNTIWPEWFVKEIESNTKV